MVIRRQAATGPPRRRRGGGLGVLARVARGDQHRGEDGAGEGEPGADQERVLEAVGERDRAVAHAVGDRRARRAVGDRDEDREAERAADLLGGVHEPRREPRLVGRSP